MNELKQSLLTWWQSRPQREQHILLLGSVVVLVSVMYWGFVQPLNQKAASMAQRVAQEKQLLSWVKQKADDIVTLRGNNGVVVSSETINQIVSSSVKRYNIELIRMQPQDDVLQVWIQPVIFTQLLDWLHDLQTKQGISVEFLDISRSKTPGMVEVKRLQLKRGG